MTLTDTLLQKINHGLFTKRQQQAFLEDIAELMRDGVPAHQAVETIGQIASGTTKDVADSIELQISQGQPLAEGMVGWYPNTIVEIIRAGERGGTLTETITSASAALAQQSKAVTSLLTSTIYPLTVIIAALSVSVFIKNSVFQNFASIKPISGWPANGVLLYHIATFVENWWWATLAGLIGIAIVTARLLYSTTGSLRHYIDKVPGLNLYSKVIAARFMQTIGLLTSNGIVLKHALTIMQNHATPYLAWHLYVMELRLSGGRDNIADVLDTGLVSKENILRLKVIAKGKGFEHALTRLGRIAANQNSKTLITAGRVLGGILLASGAGFASFMIFAIYGVGSYIGT